MAKFEGIPVLIVLSHKIKHPDDVVKILRSIDPPNLPYFDGSARVVVGTDVADTIKFLDEG